MLRRRLASALFLACLLAFAACSPATAPTATPQAAQTAAVAMPDRHAADVAEQILRGGGNAVDAAVAAAFSLAVTYPEAGNIGGGGFMLIHIDGEDAFLDYRETAPLAAHRDMYLDEDGNVTGNASLVGIRAAGVPGTVAGLWAAQRRYGSLPWQDLLAPAIRLAEEGFEVGRTLAERQLEYSASYQGRTNFETHYGGMSEGATFRQPDLARTLRRLSEQGAADFYEGVTADLIVRQMQRDGGLITKEDLNAYRAIWREPLRVSWRNYVLLSAPPPSSGGFAVAQLLEMKDHLGHLFAGLAHNSPQYIHLVAEMEKRVFADRAEYLGDPDFVDVPIERLLADDYIARRAREIDPTHISPVENVPPGLESPNTTHFSIIDRRGNAVSNTYTINDWFGSGVVVEGAGFLLNGEMDDFSVKPGVPNFYGVIGDSANAIQAGKRMLSSMSPTMLLEHGDVAMVIGTPGGPTIFTSLFQTIVNILDFGMTPEAAVGATRFHHQLLPPDLITYSPKRPLPQATIAALGERGYRAEPHFFAFGDLQVVFRRGDALQAASDPRNRGESRVLFD